MTRIQMNDPQPHSDASPRVSQRTHETYRIHVPLRLTIGILVVAISWATTVSAEEIKLWPQGAPDEKEDIGPEKVQPSTDNIKRITNVTEPTITLYPAPPATANGCCVLVCPGGGYNILAYDLEGTEVAEWLNSIGVTAVLLKYRVPRRDKENPGAVQLQDAQRALRLIRQHADDWNIDGDRVGVLGFSAGGHLTVMTGLKWDQMTYDPIDDADSLSCRPNFLIPIYAAYLGDKQDKTKLSDEVRVTKETPPAFMAVTWDDAMRGLHAGLLLAEYRKAGVAAECHVFSQGGHGYGLRASDNAVSGWPKLCEQWLRANGYLKPPKP